MKRAPIHVLSNGLRWLHEYRPGADRFFALAGTLMGTEKEPPNAVGATHFLEHMIRRKASYAQSLQFGYDNYIKERAVSGTSCSDFIEVNVRYEQSLWREAMRHLFATITGPKIDDESERERMRLLTEIGDFDADPYKALIAAMDMKLYPKTPYSRIISESARSISTLDTADALAFWNRLYRPNNMALITIGGMRRDSLANIVEETFGSMPKKRKLKPYALDTTDSINEDIDIICPGRSNTTIMHGYFMPIMDNDIQQRARLYILSDYLENILEIELSTRGLVYSVESCHSFRRPEANVDLRYQTLPDNAKQAIETTKGIVEDIANGRIDKAFFETARARVENAHEELRKDFCETGEWYMENLSKGLFVSSKYFSEVIRKVKPVDIQAELQLGLRRTVTAVGHPTEAPHYDRIPARTRQAKLAVI